MNWDEKTLESHKGRNHRKSKKCYSKGSDIYQLRKLVLECLKSYGRLDFMHSMEAAMMEKRVVAVEFKCAKNCRCCTMFKLLL